MNLKIKFSVSILLISLITNAQNTWEWVSPKPSGLNPIDIHFFDEENGLILNNYELYNTNNGGNDLKKINSFKYANDFDFIDSVGFIVGQQGLCEKTIDGGNTWTKISNIDPNIYYKVQLISKDTIVITSDQFIYKSFNGGNTWMKIESRKFSHISFIDSKIGFGILSRSGHAFKTINGGNTWEISSTVGSSSITYDYLISFNDSTFVIFTSSYECLKTINQGNTWIKQSTINFNPTCHSLINDSTCIITTENNGIYKTTNRGQDWIKISNPKVKMNHVSFVNDSIGYFVGQYNYVYKSVNAKHEFEIISPYKPFYLENSHYISFNDTTIYIYRNKGANIDTIKVDYFYGVSGVKMFEDSILYCISGRFIFKSIDYGKTWAELNLNHTVQSNEITAYDFADKNNILITAWQGTAVSNDGGKTWKRIFEFDVSGLKFITNKVACFYRDEKLYKSIDSGNTWEVIFDNTEDITSYHFIDENIGYVNGKYNYTDDKNIGHKTFDGGKTWKWYGTHCASNSTFFINENIGYQVCQGLGYHAEIYRTIDGASSWTQIEFPYINLSNYNNGFTGNLYFSSNINKDTLFVKGAQNYFLMSKIEIDTISIAIIPDYVYNAKEKSIIINVIATSLSSEISNISLIYNDYEEGDRQIIATPNFVESNSKDTLTLKITNFTKDKRYFCKLRYEYKGKIYFIECNDLYTYDMLFDTIGTKENSIKYEINIYPSVTKNDIYISNITSDSKIEIYNLNSVKLQEFQGISNIKMNSYPNGTYLIKVTNKDKKIIKYIIKK